MMKINQKLASEIKLHAAAEYPKEACGLLVKSGKMLKYYRCENHASNPNEAFFIEPESWIEVATQGEIVAVVHSHPQGQPWLSADDRQAQRQTALPWVVLAGEEIRVFECVPPLRGRVFEYGKADCGALIRDAYLLMGVELKNEQRTDLEADAESERLKIKLQREGFVQVDDLQAGDVILTSHGGQVCHATLYLGDEQIIHHALDQLSRREPYNRWWQGVTDSIWRLPSVKPEMIQAVLNDVEILA